MKLIILPYIESEIDFYIYNKRQYTCFSYWEDLRSLNNKIFFNKFKFFVEQKNPYAYLTKIFTTILLEENSDEVAYRKGISQLEDLQPLLVSIFWSGFLPFYHESFSTDVGLTSLEQLKIEIVNTHISRIIYNGWVSNIQTPWYWIIKHKDYPTHFFKIPILNGNTIKNTFYMKISNNRLSLLNEELCKYSKYFEDKYYKIIMSIYSSALASEDIIISFILFWRVLETFISILNDNGEKLIKKEDTEKIIWILENYDDETRHRIKSMINGTKKKWDKQILAEIIKKSKLFSNSDEEIKSLADKWRKTRWTIIHPNQTKSIDKIELMKSKKEIQLLVTFLIKEKYN